MLFVDGENLTIRGQKIASRSDLSLSGSNWKKDAYLWFQRPPHFFASEWVQQVVAGHGLSSRVLPTLRPRMVRGYYTAVRGDDPARAEVEEALWDLGFTPKVFKKSDPDRKSKAVDIAFTTDVLSQAYQGNFDAAFLLAGDEDYVPLVEELKHNGRVVIVGFFSGEDSGLSQRLRLVADAFADLTDFFLRPLQQEKDRANAVTAS
jgi:hypothetical protein